MPPDMQKSTPGVLPASIATTVQPFTDDEINSLFAEFDQLPPLEELRKRVKR
jgi:hypothetical protein